jgi:hypothetical protein
MFATASVRQADASLDATLNPVELSSKEIVSWGIAFPRARISNAPARGNVTHRRDDRNRARGGGWAR